MSRRDAPTVPKFGSFRARAVIAEARIDTKIDTHIDSQRQRSDNRGGQDDSYVGHVRSESLQRGSHDGREAFNDSKTFIVDIRGDPKNIEYGCLYRYSIPNYHRSGSGYVVGAMSGQRIDRNASTDKTIVLDVRSRVSESRSILSARTGNSSRQAPEVVSSTALDVAELGQDIIELKSDHSSDVEDEPQIRITSGIWGFIETG